MVDPLMIKANLRRMVGPNAPEMFHGQIIGPDLWSIGDKGTRKKLGMVPIDPKTNSMYKLMVKQYDVLYKGKQTIARLDYDLKWNIRVETPEGFDWKIVPYIALTFI